MKLAHSYSAIKLFENCPLRYYRQRIIKDVQDKGGTASIYGERIHKALEDRLRDGSALPEEAAAYETLCQSIESNAERDQVFIEKELVLNENLEPTGWWDADAWLRSKLDVLVVKGPKAVVMDWKTGKRNPDQLQMQIFAVQTFKHFPDVQEVVTSLIWLKSNATDTTMYSRPQANELWGTIISRIRRIHEAEEHGVWPAKPSGLCPYCPAKHDCPSARI